MSENIEELKQSLQLYENQLHQINDAISRSSDNLDELRSLQTNLIELISLTKESLESANQDDDPFAREYELFKAELKSDDVFTENETSENTNSIQDELDHLMGTKCQAPYAEEWAGSSATYHNALIMSFDTEEALDNIKVKVMFVNPICREMVPCQYFLDGDCKFSDDQCHFSHGHIVRFSELKEYKEPDFSLLKENIMVLAKDEDDLWKRAVITAVMPEDNQCSIKFELGRKREITVGIHHTLPLHPEEEEKEYQPQESIQIEDEEDRTQMMIEKSLTREPPSDKLGEWEKYTTGIGSKLMANMGYIVGTGLGKHGEGRVEPVVAVALPPGKSLDHCMALREKAGGDPNLFRVDRLQKKLNRKPATKVTKVISNKPGNVFDFINKSLSGTSNKDEPKSRSGSSMLKTSSSRALNVEELKINEGIEKKNYELMVLKEKLSRQKQNTIGFSTLLKQVRGIEGQLSDMHTDLKNLHKEKNYRKTMKELTEF